MNVLFSFMRVIENDLIVLIVRVFLKLCYF